MINDWFCLKHYVRLNEDYIRMSTKTSPSTDYVNILSLPNRSTMSVINFDSCPENSEHSLSNDLQMKPMVHNPG